MQLNFRSWSNRHKIWLAGFDSRLDHAKEAAWATAQANGDGRRRPLVTLRKD